MAPAQVREPFHKEEWVYEEKFDGWRMLAYKDGARVRLVSRNARDHTRRFASIAAAIAALPARSLVLDGEVAIYDEKLRSRFDWLREPDLERHRDAAHAYGIRSALPGRPRVHRAAAARATRPIGEHRRRRRSCAARAAARQEWIRGVDRADRARLRGSGREGRNEPVRGRADAAVAEGKAEGLDRLRRSVAAANQRSDNPGSGLRYPRRP
jgi:hypothetical protein